MTEFWLTCKQFFFVALALISQILGFSDHQESLKSDPRIGTTYTLRAMAVGATSLSPGFTVVKRATELNSFLLPLGECQSCGEKNFHVTQIFPAGTKFMIREVDHFTCKNCLGTNEETMLVAADPSGRLFSFSQYLLENSNSANEPNFSDFFSEVSRQTSDRLTVRMSFMPLEVLANTKGAASVTMAVAEPYYRRVLNETAPYGAKAASSPSAIDFTLSVDQSALAHLVLRRNARQIFQLTMDAAALEPRKTGL
jgi:hypothetical protein